MKLEDQVCSLELAKKLKDLGVKQASLVYFCSDIGEFTYSKDCSEAADATCGEHLSRFTVAELGEMLPKGYWNQSSVNGGFEVGYSTGKPIGPDEIDRYYALEPSEANARAKLLIALIDRHLLTVDQINQSFTS